MSALFPPWALLVVSAVCAAGLFDLVRIVRRRSSRGLDTVPARPAPRLRRHALSWVAAIAITSLLAARCSLGNYAPLRASGPVSGGGPLFLSWTPASYGGLDDYNFAYVPGGQIRFAFDLVNEGDLGVTLTGLDPDPYLPGNLPALSALFETATLGLPQAGDESLVSYRPFVATELPPGGRLRVLLILDLRYCTEAQPAPTLAPGVSPGRGLIPYGSSREGIGRAAFTYSTLGVASRQLIDLPAGLILASTGNRTGCDIPELTTPDSSSPS